MVKKIGHKRKCLVQVGKYYPPHAGGIESYTQKVSECLREDYRIYVVCAPPSSGKLKIRRWNSIPIIELSSLGTVWRQPFLVLPDKLLDRLECDCIHFHAPNPLLALELWRYLKRRPKVKLVITHHADLQRPNMIRRVANHGYRKLLQRADWVTALSENAFRNSSEIDMCGEKKAILPYGIEIPESEKRYTKHDVNRGKTEEGLRVGFLGRLEDWKGVQYLIKAFDKLKKGMLRIAGDGSYKCELQQIAWQCGARNRIQFVGELQGADKWKFLHSLDVLVLPSINQGETFGIALIEAQFCGVAVIASDLPTGVQEVVACGKCGLLVEPGNVDKLKTALDTMSDDKFRTEMAECGRRRAEVHYSIGAMKKEVRTFYRDILQNE